MIEPPYWVAPDALPAWHRIVANLQRRGEWSEMYQAMAGMAATAAAQYVRFLGYWRPQLDAETAKGLADTAEETRQLARLLLSDMGYLPIARVPVALLDADGHDADLIAICAPLTEGDE